MLGTDGQIGRYEIRRRVAHGGMGTLYLAHDPVLDRTVALKLFHGDLDLPDARDRFVGEARAVAALNNPNIVTIYDYGEYSSQPFLVMEYIQGETLAGLIRRKAEVSAGIKVRWIEDLCSAVGYAHDRGIIHRDIKPANLMIDGYGRLKVLDFGIARMRGTFASNATAVIGTPGYMAPEQLRGGAIDHRSDLFSIGVVAYELFAHVEPFCGETMHAISHRILEEEPQPLEALCPTIDRDFARIVTRALQKDADRRFPSAEAFRDAVAAVRRRFEAAEHESGVVVYVPPVSPSASNAGLATGETGGRPSGRPDAPAPARPPRRTTREAVVRQRHAQVQGWIQLAREHLDAGELGDARDACAQALSLDPAQSEALNLLHSIEGGPAHAAPGHGAEVSAAGDLGAFATGDLDATMMATARPYTAPSGGGTDATILAPSRRHHVEAPVAPAEARDTARDALEPAAVRPTRRDTRAPDVQQPLAALLSWRPSRRSVMAAAGVAGFLIVALVVVWNRAPAATPAPVLVVIDAMPWATLTAIHGENGDLVPVSDGSSTPVPLWLAPGAYRATLVGPPPTFESREVPIHVIAGAPAQVPLQRFTSMTADDYFRSYTDPETAGLSGPAADSMEPTP